MQNPTLHSTDFKKVLIQAAWQFFALAMLASLVAYLYNKRESQADHSQAMANEIYRLQLADQLILKPIQNTCMDAAFLAEQAGQEFPNGNLEDAAALEDLAMSFQSLAIGKGVYDQIRLLSPEGMEIVRVNFEGVQAETVAQDQLQDKAQRSYFLESKDLSPGQFYISPMDLNIELGEIEMPRKPVVRVCTPVVDQSDSVFGLIVVNYRAQHVLDQLAHTDRDGLGAIWLVNENGYWLKGPEEDREWGFMNPQGSDWTIARDLAPAWHLFRDADGSQRQVIQDGNLYSLLATSPRIVETSSPLEIVNAEKWALMSYLPAGYFEQIASTRHSRILLILVATYFLFGAITYIAGRSRIAKLLHQQQVKNRERLFRGLLHASPDATLVVNETGRIVIANPVAADVFLVDYEHLVGSNIESLIPPRYRKVLEELRASYLNASLPRTMASARELVGLKKDGTEFPAAISLNAFHSQAETLTIFVIRDVTQLRIYEQNEQLSAELKAFVSVASHDLRSPVRQIGSLVEALRDYQDSVPEDGQGLFDSIDKVTKRVSDLLDGLQEFSRQGSIDVGFRQVDLNEVLANVLSEIQHDVDQDSVSIHAEDLPTIAGNPVSMAVLFHNILSNGIKFNQSSTPTIRVSAEQSDSMWNIRVEDNGIGISEDHFDKIFQPLARLHSRSKYLGAGLGLATVKKILDRHHGTIHVESKIGQGSTFIIGLPSIDPAGES